MSQDVLVVAEHQKGQLADVTYELLGKGRELAAATGGKLLCAVLGHGLQDRAAALAADAVIAVDHPSLADFNPEAFGKALDAVVEARPPRLVLVANTSMGMDVAAALAARRGWPLAAYANQVAVEDGAVVATSQLYGGKIYAEQVLDGAAAVVSVLAGAFPAEPGRAAATPEVQQLDAPAALADGRLVFKGLIEPQGQDVDITQQDVLVCVGRGIQSEDNLPMVEELAHALGGAVCSSRPIVDSKWLPKTRQVGKSGLKVKPKVYLALGVSGAPEHIEGMKDAELIIAVNTDENAPIFEHAHYGTTEDLLEVVPALMARLR